MSVLRDDGPDRPEEGDRGEELADLRTLVASAHIGLWTWDLDTNRVFYSEEWKRQLGIEGETSDSLDEWASRVHPEDAERLRIEMQAVLESGAPAAQSRCRLRHADGSYRDILAQSTIVRDEGGRPIRIVGSHVDLTDARVRDRSLFAVSARLVQATSGDLEAILDDVLRIMGELEGADRCYLFLYDLEQGTMSNTQEWCAPGIEPQIDALQGIAITDLPWFHAQVCAGAVVNSPVEALPPPARALRGLLTSQDVRSLLTIPLRVGERPFGFLGFDAVREPRRFTLQNEELLRIVGDMIVSALRRVRAEQAAGAHARSLGEALERLERAEQIAGIGSWSYDPSRGAAEWSPQLFEIFGWDPAGGVPSLESVCAQVSPETREAWQSAHRDAVEHGRGFDLDFSVRRPDGAERWVRGLGQADPEPGPAGHVVRGVVRDITDLQNAERERAHLQAQLLHAQKMESIGRLAGGIAHDFNNMLGVILGNLELALDALPPDAPVIEDLRQIGRAAERSAELTRMLLAFARRRDTAPRRVDPAEASRAALTMLKRLLPEHVALRTSAPEDAWSVHIDPAHLDQILINLGVNARDALEGPGTIELEIAHVELGDRARLGIPAVPPGPYVRLTMRDDGRGMEPAIAERVFEPYFTTKAVGSGSGLGLATVYGLVEQAGGTIEVESTPGRGSAFHVFLPRAPEGPTVALDPVDAPPTPPARGEAVVLVEDEPDLAALTQRMLEQLGYRVVLAADPEDAMERIDREPEAVQALVTDVVMPKMSGLRLADTLCARHPHLRVLFMSGYASEVMGDREEKVLAKPFSSAQLAEALREVLDAPSPGARSPGPTAASS